MSDLRARLRIEGDARGAVQAVNTADQALDRLAAGGRAARGGLNEASAGADQFGRSAGLARTAAAGLAAALATVGFREIATGMKDAAFATLGFETGLSAVAGGAAGAATETAFLRAESERLGLVVQDQVNRFVSLAGATNGTALAGEATREIWLGLVEAGTALNRSNEQQQRAMEAVSQIASKGVVAMEELRGQLAEAIPGATQIAARAMGMTSGALIDLVASGDLLAEDFLPKFAAQLRREFGPTLDAQMITPLGQARREMAATATAMFDLNATAGEAFLAGAVEGIAAFNAELQDADTLEAARVLGESLGQAFGTAAEAAAFLVDNIEALVAAGQVLTTVAIARYLAAAASGAMAGAAAFRAKAIATREAAAANVAAIQAEIRSSAAMVASTTQAQRLAAAKLELARVSRLATPAVGGLGAAAGGLMALMGGPWGIAFTVAGGAVWALMERMSAAEREAAAFEEESLAIAQALAEAEAAGLGAAEAMGAVGEESGASVRPTDDLAYSLAGLGDKYAYVAAQAKAAHVNQLLFRHGKAQADVAELEEEAARTRTRSMGLLAASAGEAGLPADLAAEARASMVEDPAVAELEAKLTQRRAEAARLASMAAEAMARDTLSFAPPTAPSSGGAQGTASESKADQDAQRRLDRAREIAEQLRIETTLLEERSLAAAAGEAALDALAVKEAGLRVLRDLGVTSLEGLSAAERTAAEAAIAAAEAHERQAQATDRALRVAGAVRDLDRQIAAQRARTEAVQAGTKALLDWERQEFVRQFVEREGIGLTEEQIALLREKAELLYDAGLTGDLAAANAERRRELDLARMTVREREVEQRALEIRRRLQLEFIDLTETEAELRGKILALRELEQDEQARAIGALREDLRRAFIESGELGFDQVADYAAREIRAKIYDTLLDEPIRIVIEAVVGSVSGLKDVIGGLAGGEGSGLGSLLGAAGLGNLKGVIGGAGIGAAIGQSMGLGSGNAAADLGLSLGGSALGGMAGTALINAASMGALGAFGASGAAFALGGVLGPLGAIAGLALGSLFKDDKRPYARADIGVVDGQFAVTGGQSLDDGPLSEMNKAASAIVQSLNAASDLFKLDLTKFTGPTAIGYVQGKNTGALGQGYFGGDGGGFSTGAQFSGYEDAEALAEEIVRATIIRAIEAGASDLSEAEKRVVLEAKNLEEAATRIALGRSLAESVEDALLQLTDPAAFERKQALAAIEESYQALKAQAEELIAAGLVSGDVLARIEQLRDLQVEDALERLGEAADSAAEALKKASDLRGGVEMRILELVNPQAARAQKIEQEFAALREEALGLIGQGALSPDVLGQIDTLRQLELAQAFGQLDQALGRTTEAFAKLAPRLQTWLDQLNLSPSAELSPQAERAEALRQYQQLLAAARGGDAEAASNFTAYADRLLAADRAATLSAQDRLALFNQVRADGETLLGQAGQAAASMTAIVGMDQLQTLLAQISLNTAPLALFAANDDTARPQAVQMTNLPALANLYGEAATQGAERVVTTLVQLQGQVTAVMERHHGALDEALKPVAAALAILPAVLDERLGAMESAMSALAAQNAELAAEQRLANTHVRAALARPTPRVA